MIAGALALAGCSHSMAGSVWDVEQDHVGDRHEYVRLDGDGTAEYAQVNGDQWSKDIPSHWVVRDGRLFIEVLDDSKGLPIVGDTIHYTDGTGVWAKRVDVKWRLPPPGTRYCYQETCSGYTAPICYDTSEQCEAARSGSAPYDEACWGASLDGIGPCAASK